jgi:hypothetical protein
MNTFLKLNFSEAKNSDKYGTIDCITKPVEPVTPEQPIDEIRDLSPNLEIFNEYNTEEENIEFFAKFDEMEKSDSKPSFKNYPPRTSRSCLEAEFISQTSENSRDSSVHHYEGREEYPELDTKNTSQIYTYTVTDNVNQTLVGVSIENFQRRNFGDFEGLNI